jgi:beta-fructofuranosidase
MMAGGLATRSLALMQATVVTPAELAADPRRPQYHLLPAANWMNDPDGPIYWRGAYHMFYQYNPGGAVWGDMHWGHAVSPDMVHWRHLPLALAPTAGGPDAAGCFTGSALVDGERVAVLYTGVVAAPESEATIRDGARSLRESQCLAFCEEGDLTDWSKAPAPVIAAPPAGLDVTGFRDPAPWREGDVWYMAVGSGIRGRGGAILLYRSRDLYHWEYLHPLAEGLGAGGENAGEQGEMWECPDFFPLGEKHILIHSTGGRAYWQSGRFDRKELVFHSERGGILDYGSYYAPKTQLDAVGNRILWGWIREDRSEAEYRAAGWAGMISLPRVLRLDENNDLAMRAAPAVEHLRGRERRLRMRGDELGDRRELAGMQMENGCGEIACSLRLGQEAITITVGRRDGGAWLACRYDPSRPSEMEIEGQRVPLGTAKGTAELRFFIDGSVIECFANQSGALTRRFYYSGSRAPAIGVQVTGKMASLAGLTMWPMSPVSRDRLTT